MTLEDRIKEIAVDVASDYPGIAKADPWEQLWAIHASHTGTLQANGDLHKLLRAMGEKLGWSELQVVEFWQEVRD